MIGRKGWGTRALRLIAALVSLPLGSAMALGLPPAPDGSDGKEAALARLGCEIFFDRRLSIDGTVSCASCHMPEKAFTDGRATARGLHGTTLTRHTPSLLNVRYRTVLFWDGRATDLATQARSPLFGPLENGLPDERTLRDILRANPVYVRAFERELRKTTETLSVLDVTAAIAAYERTLVAGDSPFDRYAYGGDALAMSPAAVRGMRLFRGRAQCASCHLIERNSALLTDNLFHSSPIPLAPKVLEELPSLAKTVEDLRNAGRDAALSAIIASDIRVAALGHFVITLDPRDIGKFKTPSLRNAALTGPYMHDGSVPTLAMAVDLELYNHVVPSQPLVLAEEERADLLAFIQALSSKSAITSRKPSVKSAGSCDTSQ